MIRRPEMLNRRAKPSAMLIVMSAVLIVFAVIVLLDSLRGIFMFTVEIKGSSMLNTFYGGVSAGGDYEGGDIVYALVGSDHTLKRYVEVDGRMELQAENKEANYPPIRPSEFEDIQIRGVLVGSGRRYKA